MVLYSKPRVIASVKNAFFNALVKKNFLTKNFNTLSLNALVKKIEDYRILTLALR